MAYQDAYDAFTLKMPKKVPRVEYSVNLYWKLVQRVTGVDVSHNSSSEVKKEAIIKFEKAWDFGFYSSLDIQGQIFDGFHTKMGHAVYAEDGVDFNEEKSCPFANIEEVYNFEPFEQFGERDIEQLTKDFDKFNKRNMDEHPDQVVMTGIYVTMISGLLDLLGWDFLLIGLGEDPQKFGAVANRYADWILQYFEALAKSESEIVMIHDDIVWTSGAFANPNWYREFIFPNYEKLFDPLHKAKKKIIYISDGNFTEFIDDIATCGVDGFLMEPTTDMGYIAKKYGNTHSFVGNADCRILTYGTKEDIRKEVERCMNIGKEYPGFFLAVGNHIPSNVPIENALYYNECYEAMAYR